MSVLEILICMALTVDVFTDEEKAEWDPNGYVFFCPCMGRFGNQADHFLGGLQFAKSLDRTLVLPSFRTYRNVRFTEYFQIEPLKEFHRVILAEKFLSDLAPTHWPQEKRIGFCWLPKNSDIKGCRMKEGNPFEGFWNGLGVDFSSDEVYQLNIHAGKKWNEVYPPEDYPVLTFRGAPADFPVLSRNRPLQKYLHFSDKVMDEANHYIDEHFKGKKYVGIHLRNGRDWENACKGAEGRKSYMASPQCLEGTDQTVTKEICYPSDTEVLRLTRKIVEDSEATLVFVATDKKPMIEEITEQLADLKVQVFHADPFNPLVDLAILENSHHFIGNCVSSFTSFVSRARIYKGEKPTSFWGFS